jgi:hypothetical protein
LNKARLAAWQARRRAQYQSPHGSSAVKAITTNPSLDTMFRGGIAALFERRRNCDGHRAC